MSKIEKPTDPVDGNAQPKVSSKLHWKDSLKTAAIVGFSGLILIAAARNSLTWHLQRFWGASGDFWQRLWDNVVILCDNNDFNIAVPGLWLFSLIVFWGANLPLIAIDFLAWPKFLTRYKMQPDKNSPLEWREFFKALKVALYNQTVVTIPFMVVSYWLFKWRGMAFSGPLPTFQWVLLEIIVYTLVEEFCFYYFHRLAHHPRFYKYVHKKHHEYTASFGIVCIYAHWIEHVVVNMFPPMLGTLIMGSHLGSVWLWFMLVILSTTVSHSGYHFPFLPSPEYHDYHHLKFNTNYGMLGVLDRLHKTDAIFAASPAADRNIMLFSLTPAREQFPDIPHDKMKKGRC